MNWFRRLICWRKGHLRGKFVRQDGNVRVTACPRCGKETTRKVKSFEPMGMA